MFPFPYFNEEIILDKDEQIVVDQFHKLYFKKLEQRSGLQISWLGHHTGKLPSDLWKYQEIIYDYKPDLIVECGTYWGGSAMYLANIMDLIGHGKIISIDLYPKEPLPEHPRISYLSGSSVNPLIIQQVARAAEQSQRIIVILDSDHNADHVLSELNAYSNLIPRDGYLIVEDTFLGGNPSHEEYGKGPSIAIREFLSSNQEFFIDKKNERFLFTLNKDGFLRRKK